MLACLQLGPLRNVAGTAEVAGCLSGAALVGILTVCLTIYGGATFQEGSEMTKKTLSGRVLPTDELQSASGYVPPGTGCVVRSLLGVPHDSCTAFCGRLGVHSTDSWL